MTIENQTPDVAAVVAAVRARVIERDAGSYEFYDESGFGSGFGFATASTR